MRENEISGIVLDTCIRIHSTLGPGAFEAVYEDFLFYELQKKGLTVERQKAIDLVWDNQIMGCAFRADLIVEDRVLIELKAIDALAPVHFKQVNTFLKITGIRLGLLINFNVDWVKNGFHRIANRL